jgi:hypothetical protein
MKSGQIHLMIWTLQHQLDFGVLVRGSLAEISNQVWLSLALAQLLHMVNALLTN